MEELTFKERVYEAVRQIPDGMVATYGLIAEAAGSPRAARAVGNALHKNPDPIKTPCFKVVNAKGELAKDFVFGGKIRQRELLEADGIHVENFRVDLDEYLWRP